jgi:AraC-like DNA-binding protein
MPEEQTTTQPIDLPIHYHPRELFMFEGHPAGSYRLIALESGTGMLRFNGEKRLLVAPPTVLCLNETDQVELIAVQNLVAESIEFHPKVVNYNFDFVNMKDPSRMNSLDEQLDAYNFKPFINRDRAYAGQINVGPATFQRVRQLLRSIGNVIENRQEQYRPCRTRSYLLELLFLLFQLGSSVNWVGELTPKNESNPADKIVVYLINHYPQKITINELTKIFNLNRNSLYQQFESVTGLPLIAYLIKLRMKVATMLLSETSMSVAEIMERVGYTDLTHFGRLFKKEMGCTPYDYRKLTTAKPQ